MNELPQWNLDDVVDPALFPLPLDNGGFASLASVKEHAERHGETSPAHTDVHSPLAHFVVRHFVDERRQTTFHRYSPSLNTTERFDSQDCRREDCKRLNKLPFVNPVSFLPTASIWRQAA